MSDSAFQIWCNARLPLAIKERMQRTLAGQNLSFAAPGPGVRESNVAVLAPIPAGAEILFGQPDPGQVINTASVRWVHLNSAAYTNFDRPEIRKAMEDRGVALTTSSFVYAEPVAQHLLAMMMGIARCLPAALDAQRGPRDWAFHKLRSESQLLHGQTVLILGYGHIGQRFAELLAPLNLKVIAIKRRVSGQEAVPVFTENDLDHLLPETDHLVNILPSNPETNKYLNAKRLGALKRGSVVYNIGRGTTLDQEALIHGLISGHLAAAYLDVTEPEPLPPDHPLWSAPNCYITPHTGGGRHDEMESLADHFLNNFRRFSLGEEMRNRVI
jgi:phosphoglycerate dehydrogenase-like enzyme